MSTSNTEFLAARLAPIIGSRAAPGPDLDARQVPGLDRAGREQPVDRLRRPHEGLVDVLPLLRRGLEEEQPVLVRERAALGLRDRARRLA